MNIIKKIKQWNQERRARNILQDAAPYQHNTWIVAVQWYDTKNVTNILIHTSEHLTDETEVYLYMNRRYKGLNTEYGIVNIIRL